MHDVPDTGFKATTWLTFIFVYTWPWGCWCQGQHSSALYHVTAYGFYSPPQSWAGNHTYSKPLMRKAKQADNWIILWAVQTGSEILLFKGVGVMGGGGFPVPSIFRFPGNSQPQHLDLWSLWTLEATWAPAFHVFKMPLYDSKQGPLWSEVSTHEKQ